MGETAQNNDGLVFTDAAARKVGELIREEGNPKLKLRVFVSGGGCSGFQYGFTFDEKVEEGDAEFPNQGVTLLVDPLSFQYLAGAEIDYREDLEGARKRLNVLALALDPSIVHTVDVIEPAAGKKRA